MKQETQFSLFQALSTKQPPTLITLAEVYRLVTTDATLKENTEKYRYFKAQGFTKEADEIKRMRCLAFTPAAVFDRYRRYGSIVSITQYSMVDIDGLTEDEAVRLMKRLEEDPHWLLAYITISGKGLRIIFRVEGVTDQQSYLKAFYQGNAHYCRLLGITHFDDQVKDMTRSSGLCHDAHARYREEAKVFPVEYDKVSVPEVWKIIEEILAGRGCVYEPGNHNDYICQAGYLLNAYGVDEEEATEWMQRRFSDYDASRTKSHIRSCYSTHPEEHGTLKPGSRPKATKRKKPAKPKVEQPKYMPVEEIEASLTELADFRWNEITRMTEIRWKDKEEGFRPLTDRDEGTLWSRINKQPQKTMRFNDLRLVLGSEYVPLHHPFKAYFYGLPEWQEGSVDYIKQLAETVTLADDTPEARYTFYHCLKKWLVAMVAGFLSDRVNHEILVLIGRQGIYKTTWFHFLLPPELRAYYVAKNNSRRMSKDERLLMAEVGLICLEEIVTMMDEEVDQIRKHFRIPQPGEAYEIYSVADVLGVINMELKVQLSSTKVGMLLNKLGFKSVRTNKLRGYKVCRYNLEEISNNRKEKVNDAQEQSLPF